MSMQFPRDVKNRRPLFTQKSFTDVILDFLEALAGATFSPVGSGRTESSRNSVIYKINLGSGSTAGPCYLGASDATDDAGPKLAFAFGTINNMLPAGMSPGNTPPYSLSVSGSGFIFARADFDLTNLQTVAASIQLSSSGIQANQATTGFQLIGTYLVAGDRKSVAVNSSCGNVTIDVCALLSNTDQGGSGDGEGGDGGDGSSEGGLGDAGGLGDSGGLGDDGGLS